jgi:ATP-dependent Lon protease
MKLTLDAIPDQVLSELPLFPLPNTVLFPGMMLPLQVFEPRYLDLMNHCLEHHRVFAVPLLKPGHEEHYDGRPPVHSMVGAGVISGHRLLDDGRMTVVLHGVERVRLIEELPAGQTFRLARAERVIEEQRDADLGDELVILSNLLSQLGQARPQAALILSQIEEVADDIPELIDLLAAYVIGDLGLRQELLSELNVLARFARLTQIVADIVLQVSADEVLH